MYYNENTVLFNNGKFLKAMDTTTDLYGQTFHYGYGVFEGIRSYETSSGANVFKVKEHYERLIRSAELLHIPFTYSVEELTEYTYKVLKRNNLSNAYIRPVVYGEPNMSLNKPAKSNLVICVWEWGVYLGDKMLKVCMSSYQRPNPKSVNVEAKANGHYVNSILAAIDAKEKGFDEALLLDMNGNVAEAPGSNFFCEKDGKLFTPPLGNILPGITRATVLELCEELNIPFEVQHIRPEELKEMDSAFLCGTAVEVLGIESLDGVAFPKKWNDTKGAEIQKAYTLLVKNKNYKPQLVLQNE
ncbi:MAG TPA: branched-chain amino acid transaminase [Bacteroidia bacterium]